MIGVEHWCRVSLKHRAYCVRIELGYTSTPNFCHVSCSCDLVYMILTSGYTEGPAELGILILPPIVILMILYLLVFT